MQTRDRLLFLHLAAAAVYIASARLGLLFALPPENKATAVWPPSGIALALLVLFGPRLWSGIWVGAFLANLWDYFTSGNTSSFVNHWSASTAIACGSTLQALVGAFVISRWVQGPDLFKQTDRIFRFIVAAPILCVIAGSIGSTSLCALGMAPWSALPSTWLTWWLGDTAGVLLFTPFLLVWSKRPAASMRPRSAIKVVAMQLVFVGLVTVVFVSPRYLGLPPDALIYAVVPIVIWAAVHFGPQGATAAIVMLTAVALGFTTLGDGPFVRGSFNRSLLELQAFLSVLAATAFIVAAVLTERRDAERLLRAVTEGTTDAVFVKDRAGIYLLINDAAARFVGRTPGELLGKTDTTLFDPESARMVMERDQRVMEGGIPETEEETLTAVGITRTYQATKAPYMDDRGNILGLIGVSRDVTAHKEDERALRESEEGLRLFRELVDQINDAVEVIDPESGRYLDVNETACQVHGYTREEYLSLSVRDIDPIIATRPWHKVIEPLLGGSSQLIESIHQRKDGSTFPVEVNVRCVRLHREFMIAVVRDLTERKRAEASLLLRDRAIRAVSQGILITDSSRPDHPIQYVNTSFETMTGYTSQEVLGRNCRFLQGRQTDRNVVAQIREAIAAVRPCTVTLQNYRKDGTAFWNELSITPVFDEAGRLTNFIGIQIDVTRRLAMESQLRQSHKMQAVGRLAGGVAHDFNNLLTIINGYSAVLLRDLPGDDPSREMLEEIHHAGKQSASLTRQLLAFGSQNISVRKMFNPNSVIRQTEKLLRRVIGEDVSMTLDLAPGLWPVEADEGQLEQVLMNLATNARDSMPTGGNFVIRTLNFAGAAGDAPGEPCVRVTVSDNGQGMTGEVQEKIFEPFFTTKPMGRGTGLGLSIVHNIVSQSGGRIHVVSDVGVGTTFHIDLPRAGDAAPASLGDTADSLQPGNETVLLIEDDPNVLAYSRYVLTDCGYSVLTGTTPGEAEKVAVMHEGTIDLLVTDVVLPGGGGREVAERVLKWHEGIRVLFVSGYTDDEVMRHGVLHREVHFLHKPFTPIELARKVREVLDNFAEGVRGLSSGDSRPSSETPRSEGTDARS